MIATSKATRACEDCDGTGEIVDANGIAIYCPDCDGAGTLSDITPEASHEQ